MRVGEPQVQGDMRAGEKLRQHLPGGALHRRPLCRGSQEVHVHQALLNHLSTYVEHDHRNYIRIREIK
ncbi:hypothetical protein Scep_003655 [Stephania cephalantha]|uniref:Uncharacterized protein n=1 Tax=Stephania cephalantha TaxID=152367 RepID=A0AAP0KR12_9MAGN